MIPGIEVLEHVTTLLAHACVFLGLFTRLTTTQVLEHHGRQRILALAEARPNLRMCDLLADSELATGTFRHHVRVLERAGLLRSHAHGRTRRFLARSLIQRQGQAAFHVPETEIRRSDATLDSIVDQVGVEPVRLSALMSRLRGSQGLTRMGAWKVVQRGIRYGFLARTRDGQRVYVHRSKASTGSRAAIAPMEPAATPALKIARGGHVAARPPGSDAVTKGRPVRVLDPWRA